MARSDNVRPVIIKRKKVVVGGGHHGGAWKVAYADFVTAMMAFFLMLWLLGSVSEDQRKGIADYFSPTISIQSHSAGGEQILGGESLSIASSLSDRIATREEFDAETQALQDVAEQLRALTGQSADPQLLLQHVNIELTDEGLVVELFDLPERALFAGLGSEPTAVLSALVAIVSQTFQMVENEISVEAHAASLPLVLRENPIWPMTLARAAALRDMLLANVTSDYRIVRAIGHADRDLVHANPMDARNNRLELILLRTVPTPQRR
jgi:chemotaxis protein MotB